MKIGTPIPITNMHKESCLWPIKVQSLIKKWDCYGVPFKDNDPVYQHGIDSDNQLRTMPFIIHIKIDQGDHNTHIYKKYKEKAIDITQAIVWVTWWIHTLSSIDLIDSLMATSDINVTCFTYCVLLQTKVSWIHPHNKEQVITEQYTVYLYINHLHE